MTRFYLNILVFLSFLVSLGFSYKVLIYNPAYGGSHSNFLGKITDILVDAGNEVHMLIPVYINDKKDLVGTKKVAKIFRIGQDQRAKALIEEEGVEEILRARIWTMEPQMTSLLGKVNTLNSAVGYQCEYNFQHTEILNELRNENYDLGITESLFICGFPIFDHIGIKTVINADSNLYKEAAKSAHGEPASMSYCPALFSPNNDKMNFWERIKNIGMVAFTSHLFGSRYTQELEMIKSYYNGSKTWNEHLSDVAFYFVNSNRYLDYARPTLPKTVFVGGLQVNTKKTGKVLLDKEWDELLNKRKLNVLVSFGSIAFSSDMPVEFKNAFLEVFASMPNVTFIWKYEEPNSTLAKHLNNVKLTTWMPQNDLLADPRLSLFVTHGGLGSTMELAYNGKPAVLIPLLSDQPRNSHMLSRFGGSLELHKSHLNNPSQIRKAIETVLGNSQYRENAKKLGKILEDQPYDPKDVVLRHCNFAVMHGTLDTLASEGRNLNTLQYYSLDIAFAAVVVLIFLCIILFYMFRLLFSVIYHLFTVLSCSIQKLKKE